MIRSRLLVLVVALLTVLAACSGGDSGGGGGSASGGGGGAADVKCPVDALEQADGPVTITFWHGLNRAPEEVLQKLIADYEAQQPNVDVELINQTGYRETFEKYKAGLSTGDLPDLVQIEEIGTQQLIDTQSVVPMASCVQADDYDTEDFLPRVLAYYTVEDTLWPMPFNVSNPVLYYDKSVFTAAGLDPEQPPTSLDEVAEYSRQIKERVGYPYGYGLKLDPWLIEQMGAKAGSPYVNNGNGRNARATKAVYDNEVGDEIFGWMNEMVDEDLAVTNPDQGPSAIDNLLGIRSKQQAMTLDTSSALGTISQVMASGEGGGVSLGVGPMPAPEGEGGALVGGGALYIPRRSSPEKQAAAWDLIKFLVSSESQAEWAAGTGYIPIRESSAASSVVTDVWASEPGYKVAYDQLLEGVINTATDGPVIGPYRELRDIMTAGMERMLTGGQDPDQALAATAKEANEALADYNSRIGEG